MITPPMPYTNKTMVTTAATIIPPAPGILFLPPTSMPTTYSPSQESFSNLTALKRMAESGEDTSPSFMINRFLPVANALAPSSALRYYSRSWNNKTSYRSYSSGCTVTRNEVEVEAEGRRYRKACGMERVFQRRMKPWFLCGDRSSPVLRPPSILGNRRNPNPC